jgi:hypothetical protein
MNRLTRMLTMAGLGLVTGVTLGAGPAMAAGSTDQGAAQSTNASSRWGDDEHIVGFFPSWFSCERAGDWGDDEGWWNDYDCVRVGSGFGNRFGSGFGNRFGSGWGNRFGSGFGSGWGNRYALIVDDNDWCGGWNNRWGGHNVGQWWQGGGNWWQWGN